MTEPALRKQPRPPQVAEPRPAVEAVEQEEEEEGEAPRVVRKRARGRTHSPAGAVAAVEQQAAHTQAPAHTRNQEAVVEVEPAVAEEAAGQPAVRIQALERTRNPAEEVEVEPVEAAGQPDARSRERARMYILEGEEVVEPTAEEAAAEAPRPSHEQQPQPVASAPGDGIAGNPCKPEEPLPRI